MEWRAKKYFNVNYNYKFPDFSSDVVAINVYDISKFTSLPIRIEIINSIDCTLVYATSITTDYYETWYGPGEMKDVIIRDANGEKIFERKWNLTDGTRLLKCLHNFCHKMTSHNNKPTGLAIGTHAGYFGEWVPAVREKISNAFLIEASNKQFNRLYENYNDFSNVKLYEKLITTDGKDIEFFENYDPTIDEGKGYINTVVKGLFPEHEKIHGRMSPSTSLNEFIIKEMDGKIDWLHLDVEGYDAKLLLSMDEMLYSLPKLIIWEYTLIKQEEKLSLEKFLIDKGYTVDYDISNNNAIAVKEKEKYE